MPDELPDAFFIQLCEGYTEAETAEIQQYIEEWAVGTYINVAHSVLDHATRKQIDPLRYLRKAHTFNKKRAHVVDVLAGLEAFLFGCFSRRDRMAGCAAVQPPASHAERQDNPFSGDGE